MVDLSTWLAFFGVTYRGGTALPSMKNRREILTVVSTDDASIDALRRALALSEVFSARLHVVVPLRLGSRPLVQREEEVRRDVVRWAAAKAKVVLSKQQVRVGLGDRAIDLAAAETNAELLVVGSGDANLAAASIDTARALSRSLLVAAPPRTSHEVIAATDLTELTCPVVTTASRFAGALSARVTIVHTIEDSLQATERERLPSRIRRLETLARQLAGVRAGYFSVSKTAAEAIADVAKNRDADIAVVGLRRGHGRTLSSLLERAVCSVLAIPLD